MTASANHLLQHLQRRVDSARSETAADNQLLACWAADRDSQAFAVLVGRYGPIVWRVCRSTLAHHEDAEDAFQATFLLLARKADTLKRRASVVGWVYETAFRLALNTRKASARRRRREEQVRQSVSPEPMEELTVREARTILTEELQQLRSAYRDPVVLCLFEGATQDEAARQLGCALSTLKRRLERGRTLLAQRLTRRGLVPATALAVTLSSQTVVSGRVVQATLTAAAEYVRGATLTGGAVALAESFLRTHLLKKLAICLTVLLAVTGLTLGAGFVFAPPVPPLPKQRAPEPFQAKTQDKPSLAPRLDRLGDPLPPGAFNRLGSQRFRHSDFVRQLAYAPDGKAIASTCADGSVRLWDAATGKLRWRFATDKGETLEMPIPALAFSNDGQRLAMLTNGGYKVIDTSTGKVVVHHKLPTPKNLSAMSPSLAIAPDLTMFALGFRDAVVQFYDAVTGKEKQRIQVGEKNDGEYLSNIAFAADGKMIYVLGGQTTEVLVFDTTTLQRVKTLKTGVQLLRPEMVFSRDVRQLALFGYVREPDPKNPSKMKNPPPTRLMLWDLQTPKPRHTLAMPLGFCGAFSTDGKRFAIATAKDIVLFDTATGKEERRMPLLGNALSLAFAPNNQTLAAGDIANSITLREVATGKFQAPLPEPSGRILGTRFPVGGKQLVTFGLDGVSWWDVAGGQRVRHYQGEPSLRLHGHPLSANEKLFVHRGEGGDMVLVDVATKQPLRTLKGHQYAVRGVAFSSDSARLFSAGDGRVIVWEVGSGKPLREMEHKNAAHVVVSPDGRWLASWASDKLAGFKSVKGIYDIRLWDVATGKLTYRLTPRRGAAFDAMFSADSTRLAIVGGDPGQLNIIGSSIGKANAVQLWDVVTGKEVRTFQGNQERVTCVAISADGRTIATGKWRLPTDSDSNCTVQLWEVATGTERGRIQGHESRVDTVTFAPSGRLLAATSSDAPIYHWNIYALEKSQWPAKGLTKEHKDQLWQLLASEDATKAFQAVCALIARPEEAVVILQDGWQRVPRATSQQMQKWIEDMQSNQFSVRQKAQVEVERHLAGHEPLLGKAMEKANTLEFRQRLTQMLNRLHPERLRRTRMLEVLERIGVGPALQFLQTLAGQTEDVETAREATAGLKRLER